MYGLPYLVRVATLNPPVICVPFHCLHTAFVKVIQFFNSLVVACGDQVRLIGARKKVDVVDALVVGVYGVVGYWQANVPHPYGAA